MNHNSLAARLKATSFSTFGKFPLFKGKREFVPKPGSTAANDNGVWFMHYESSFQCVGNSFLPVVIRIYSPRDEPPLPDYTVLDLFARACTAPSSPAMLECMTASAIPGDPEDLDYEDKIPENTIPHVSILGIVAGNSEQLPDGARAFTIEAQSRVCSVDRRSRIKCVFEAGRRWANLRVPPANATVLVLGHCRGTSPLGELIVSIDDITLNAQLTDPTPSTTTPNPASPASDLSQPSTPQRKRRFNPYSPSDSSPIAALQQSSPANAGPSRSRANVTFGSGIPPTTSAPASSVGYMVPPPESESETLSSLSTLASQLDGDVELHAGDTSGAPPPAKRARRGKDKDGK